MDYRSSDQQRGWLPPLTNDFSPGRPAYRSRILLRDVSLSLPAMRRPGGDCSYQIVINGLDRRQVEHIPWS